MRKKLGPIVAWAVTLAILVYLFRTIPFAHPPALRWKGALLPPTAGRLWRAAGTYGARAAYGVGRGDGAVGQRRCSGRSPDGP